MTPSRAAALIATAVAALGACQIIFPPRGFDTLVETEAGPPPAEAGPPACAAPEAGTCDGGCVLASGEIDPFAIAVDPSPCGKVFWAARSCGQGADPPKGQVRMV